MAGLVGFLAGDGALDLLFGRGRHSRGGVCLHLSSLARSGALGGLLACHMAAGC